jgi:hypothetical protein
MNHSATLNENLIYQHTLRPQWGLAIPVWRKDDKRAFQFEDGEVRVFKRGYLDLLQAVDAPPDKTARTLARLGVADDLGKKIDTKGALPFAAQVALFASLYPKGFKGSKWRKAKRGFDAKRRLKRHRNPAITEATTVLAEEPLKAMVAAGEYVELHQRLVGLLESTNLVTKAQVRPLKELPEAQIRLVAMALHGLLHGDGKFPIRFERWVTELETALGKTPKWSLVTAPLALAKPGEYVCVKRSSFTRQAKWMAPRLRGLSKVSARTYERLNRMAKMVGDELESAGLAPRDMIDVYDFIVDTLTPKNIEKARAMHAESTSKGTSDGETEAVSA